jgi:hypothetical protein
MPDLRISLVSSFSGNEYDDKFESVFNNLVSYVKNENPEFNFNGIELLKLSYESEPFILSRNCIASLTPAKFLACKETLSDKIIPILTVKKVHQKLPYFSAFFITNKDSEITSINSDKIKRIFLVSSVSTSGYIAPLYKLWESGIISTPNESGIREKGWEMILVGNQRDIETEIISDKEAIGATGQFINQEEPEKSFVRPILRYYNLPQDVIVISSNLLPFQAQITNWFIQIFETGPDNRYTRDEGRILSESSTKISSVNKLDTEFQNSLNDLQRMIRRVKAVPDNTVRTLKTYRIFLASSEELRSDRDSFEIFMSRENNEYVKSGFYFELIRWENFMDSMSKDGLQSEYNRAIKNSDIFVCLFFTKVGKFTEEEFEVAFGQFKEANRPLIYTYFKDAPVQVESITDEINSLLRFREKLKVLGHYRTVYKDTGDLQYQFKTQLQKFLDTGI